MQWFSVTRSSGEKTGPGEFVVEDEDGVEWQVTVIYSKKVLGELTYLNEIACMNRRYECDWELRGDLHDAVKEFIKKEAGDGDSGC